MTQHAGIALRSGSVGPAAIGLMGLAIMLVAHAVMFVIVMLIYCLMVPHFVSVYRDFHTTLPALTQWTIDLSAFSCSFAGAGLAGFMLFCDIGVTVVAHLILGLRTAMVWTVLVFAITFFVVFVTIVALFLPMYHLMT